MFDLIYMTINCLSFNYILKTIYWKIFQGRRFNTAKLILIAPFIMQLNFTKYFKMSAVEYFHSLPGK